MEYITTKEVDKNWGITDRMVVYYCSDRRINEAKKIENTGLIPIDVEKPVDERYRGNKVKAGENE
ncbi:hypothetical protein [Clostridium sp. ATCC 25772]|uniref:hypothetical protein n=1 Tax=Clostridium sp. ATCC 25772 TaxID=1676991 RepID=UPI00078142B4|nr:hypothetical protein [Clostridium sp. ATCC 25772]